MTSLPAVAVVGVGSIGCGDFRHESLAAMTNRAVSGALADSGLARGDIDGLFVHIGSPRGLDYDELALLLGLEVEFAIQTWSHGRFGATVISAAAMTLQCGLVDVALCVGAFKNSPFGRPGSTTSVGFLEGMREGGGPHAETPYVGMAAPIGGAAMSTRRYLDRYGIDREQLGAIAVAQRNGARSNPGAVLRDPLSREEYERSRYVVEPLRLLDCSMPADTAVAVLLTREDRARALAQPAVWLLGHQGLRAGPNEFIFGQPGLGINQAETFDFAPSSRDRAVFERAGVRVEDVGTLHCYDGFSTQVLWTLERFGFCAPGEAADFVQDGRIELDGGLPVNTAGGHLSEGHANGWGHTVELVRQLRGQAVERQVEGLTIGLWATTLGDSIVYANERP